MVLKYAGGIKILIGILMVLCSSQDPVQGQLSGKSRKRHFFFIKNERNLWICSRRAYLVQSQVHLRFSLFSLFENSQYTVRSENTFTLQ